MPDSACDHGPCADDGDAGQRPGSSLAVTFNLASLKNTFISKSGAGNSGFKEPGAVDRRHHDRTARPGYVFYLPLV
eukprot:756760-Hanusia_phi.AAC.7